MTLPEISKVRVPILVALAVGEVAALFYFYEQSVLDPFHDHRRFIGVLELCLMALALTVPYLWSDWLERRNIQYFEVAIVVVLGPGAVMHFSKGKLFEAILDAVISLVFFIAILPRLLGYANRNRRPAAVGSKQHAESGDRFGSRSDADYHGSSGGRYFGMLIVWLVGIALFLRYVRRPIPVWIEGALMLPAVWFAWRSILDFLKRLSEIRHANASITKGKE